MARSTKPPSAARVKLAVRMRRGGSTWRAIGFETGCAAETVRQWPRVYPEEWQAAVRAEAARMAGAATSEVVGSLRMMLNDDRPMVRLRAARSLIDLETGRKRVEIEAKAAEFSPSEWWKSTLASLQERSHVELKAFGELCLQLAESKRNSAQPVRPSAV